MISNLKAYFLSLVGMLIISTNLFSISADNYSRIINYFNVNSINFEYGYPLGYKYEKNNCKGIIFLSKNTERLEFFNGLVNVVEPTFENAEKIARSNIEKGVRPPNWTSQIYYLAVDSMITYKEINCFIKTLGYSNYITQVRLTNGNGKYIPIKYFNSAYLLHYNRNVGTGCRFESTIYIEMKEGDSINIRNRVHNFNGVAPFLTTHYGHNIEYHDCIDCSRKKIINKRICLKNINELERLMDKDKENVFYAQQLFKEKKMLHLTEKYYSFPVMGRFELLLTLNHEISLKAFFDLLNEIQKSVFIARNNRSKQQYIGSYLSLFEQNKKDELFLLELFNPDAITIEFGEGIYQTYSPLTNL